MKKASSPSDVCSFYPYLLLNCCLKLSYPCFHQCYFREWADPQVTELTFYELMLVLHLNVIFLPEVLLNHRPTSFLETSPSAGIMPEATGKMSMVWKWKQNIQHPSILHWGCIFPNEKKMSVSTSRSLSAAISCSIVNNIVILFMCLMANWCLHTSPRSSTGKQVRLTLPVRRSM